MAHRFIDALLKSFGPETIKLFQKPKGNCEFRTGMKNSEFAYQLMADKPKSKLPWNISEIGPRAFLL